MAEPSDWIVGQVAVVLWVVKVVIDPDRKLGPMTKLLCLRRAANGSWRPPLT